MIHDPMVHENTAYGTLLVQRLVSKTNFLFLFL